MKAEDGLSDDAQSSEGAGDELGKVVASDVFDDFAAAASERAVGKRDGYTYDEIAQRAKAQAKRAAVVRGENAADGRFFRPQRIEREALAVQGESFLQGLNGAAGLDGDGHIGPSVFEDPVHSGGRENEVGARRRIAPIEFRAAAAGNDSETNCVAQAEDFGKFNFGAWG